MQISGETARYELTHLNLYCLQFAKSSILPLALKELTVFQLQHICFRRHWLIDWGLTPFSTISQLYHGRQFTYSCISWFSHTSTPHNNLPKQLAAFPHRLSSLVEDEWRMSHWLLSIVGKKVGRAGIRTHNPWIDSPRRYRLSYRGSAQTTLKTSKLK